MFFNCAVFISILCLYTNIILTEKCSRVIVFTSKDLKVRTHKANIFYKIYLSKYYVRLKVRIHEKNICYVGYILFAQISVLSKYKLCSSINEYFPTSEFTHFFGLSSQKRVTKNPSSLVFVLLFPPQEMGDFKIGNMYVFIYGLTQLFAASCDTI